MVSIVGVAIGALVIYWIVNYFRKLSANIAAAKQSGLPYVIAPLYTFSRTWMITHALWLPFFEALPTAWTEPFLTFLQPNWPWLQKYAPFRKLGDTFLVVAPSHTSLFVADAEAHAQITARRNDFPKPLELYKTIDIFGKNVITTEGTVWRHHRKITSVPFSEKNNSLVWSESIHQAKGMLTHWTGPDGSKQEEFDDAADVTKALSLHVISRAGFGVGLKWPHEETGAVEPIPEGHTMTYKTSLQTLIDDLLLILLVPHWLLSRLPFKIMKRAWESYVNWSDYQKEMFESRKADIRAGKPVDGLDLMGALVKGAGFSADSPSTAEKGGKSSQLLSDDEIFGNLFVFILAGHETTANTFHYILIYLAMHPSSQRHLQRDLDEIFGTRPISEWSYDHDCPRLFGSMAGAIMNEQLRLIPPVIGIPKSTQIDSPQPLTLDGRRYIVPADTKITLNTAATGRNPRYWPTMVGPNATTAEIDEDLDTFKPERWLMDPSIKKTVPKAVDTSQFKDATDTEDLGGPNSADTSAQLFRPVKGAYIPFSEGHRACLGRRFAQVEVLAVLAVLFRDYTIELGTDMWCPENELLAMDMEARRKVWEKSRARAAGLFKNGMRPLITLQMKGGAVPLRFVSRGGERFPFEA